MTEAEKSLLAFLATALFSAPLPDTTATDWKAVLKESLAQGVQPLVYGAVREVLPQAEQGEWKRLATVRIARNLDCRREYAEAAEALKKSGVPFVMLKGTASAQYYPEPELRTMGDVDFLTEDAHRTVAEKAILERGFVRRTDLGDPEIEWVYRRGDHSVWELHAKLNGIPKGEAGSRAEAELKSILASGVTLTVREGAYPVPCTLHHGIVLLLHTAHHLTESGIGLRHFCDWAVFSAALSEEAFTETFRQPLTDLGLWDFAVILTRTAELALSAPPRRFCRGVEEELCRQLTEDLFRSGNLGEKDKTRKGQRNYLLDRNSGRVSHRRPMAQLWDNLAVAAKRDYPNAPLALSWPLTAVRCTAELLAGKRTLGDRKTVASAMARRDLYARLHLYEQNRGKEERP